MHRGLYPDPVRGCAEVGETGQTVNLLLRLSRFESYHPHMYTINCGSSSVGRASAFQAEGRGFESRLPLKFEMMSLLGLMSKVLLK